MTKDSKFITIEQAAKLTGKSIRTIRRYIDKLDDNVKLNVIAKSDNKILIRTDFVKSWTNVTVNVTTEETIPSADQLMLDDLKRQISRLEKQVDDKDNKIGNLVNDLKLLTSKVLYLEEAKTKLSDDAAAELKKIELEKKELLILKVKLEEQLTNEKTILTERLSTEQSKSKTAYFIAGLMALFVLILMFILMIMSSYW